MTSTRRNSIKFTDNGNAAEKLSYQISTAIGKFFYKYVQRSENNEEDCNN